MSRGWASAVSSFAKQACTQGRAADIKVKGNAAFTAGKFEEAVKLFTDCIQLDSE